MIKFDKLWETIKKKGMSTYRLREKHGIDPQIICRMKANKNTTTDTLNKFCAILDCSLSDIAEYVPDVIDGDDKNEIYYIE